MRILIVLACGLVMGCGSGSPFDYDKVSGKLTYEDGSPIPGGGLRLRFIAQDAPQVENAFPRPAFANVDAQGEFAGVTSHKFGDGLIPGKHKVAIEKEGLPDARPPVPKEYLSINTTPLVVDTEDSPFHIKVPKPKGKP
ncbi:MAG: hypothetical protein L0228_09065 [Planctomycetes bacterium]|nr:hypothetical protein [Planctomycetota bacterium]